MTTPIFDQTAYDWFGYLARYHDHQPPQRQQETDVSELDAIRDDFDRVIENHRPGVEKALADAATLAGNPLAQTVLGLVHVPPSVLQKTAEYLTELEARFAELAPPPAQ